jgi:hypothetical protein
MGSSPTYPLRIDMTKDEKVGQIYVLCLLESSVQISPAPPKQASSEQKLGNSFARALNWLFSNNQQ